MSQISTKVAKSDSVVETGCVPKWANRAYLGSCERMAEIPDASVHCCVTSPPYLGLRDYNAPGQIGLEPTIADYINRLVNVFREVRRVLRADGTAWVNIGDSYAGSWGKQSRSADRGTQRPINGEMLQPVHDGRYASASHTGVIRDPGLKPKDLRGIPWRLAFALQDDGWWLRDAIIWAKPNPMPSSIDDRCTPSYETIFMLAKSERYYADMDAVRSKDCGKPSGNGFVRPERLSVGRGQTNQWQPGGGANLRNVWTISTKTYREAHFATFPIELPSRCIRIGTSEAGCCSACGAMYRRKTSRVVEQRSGSGRSGNAIVGKNDRSSMDGQIREGHDIRNGPTPVVTTLGWEPSCACNAQTIPCTVIDPFLGSGTTAEAAEVLGRQWVGYEINPDYHALITARTRQMGLL